MLKLLKSSKLRVKVRGHPRTGHEGLGVEERYSSILSLTSVLDRSGWSTPRLGRLALRERPGTHFRGGWVGPRAGLEGCGKSHPHQDLITGPSSS